MGRFQRVFERKDIAVALNQMIGFPEAMPEKVVNGGNPGYITYRGNLYVFQPLDSQDQRIPIAQRTRQLLRQSYLIPLNLSAWEANRTDSKTAVGVSENVRISEFNVHLREILRLSNPVAQHEYLDFEMSNSARAVMLEYLIEHNLPDYILMYFQNFLIQNDENQIYGHFFSSIPRCWTTDGGWKVCGLSEKHKIDVIKSKLYTEKEADYVGFMSSKAGHRPVFKIVNNTSQRDKTRLDLEIALNTLTKGKTCATFDRVILNYVAQSIDVPTGLSNQQNKSTICKNIERALRRRQVEQYIRQSFDKQDIHSLKRYFYNVIETDQKIQISQDSVNR